MYSNVCYETASSTERVRDRLASVKRLDFMHVNLISKHLHTERMKDDNLTFSLPGKRHLGGGKMLERRMTLAEEKLLTWSDSREEITSPLPAYNSDYVG